MMSGPSTATPSPLRVTSVDVMRGLTILAMIFVNDISGVPDTPAWLKHIQPPFADGMTLVDVVFPAFLFIVGLSIPLALRSRLAKGETTRGTVLHVLTRSLSLLVIGVFMVNAEHIASPGLLDENLWNLLAYSGVILFWVRWPARGPQEARLQRVLQVAGVMVMAAAALLYRAEAGSGLFQMRPHWWGILGLIGWAYLVATLTYLLVRGNPGLLLAASAALFAFYIALEAGWVEWLHRTPPFGSAGPTLGSHGALVLLGAFMGRMFLPEAPRRTLAARALWRALVAAGFAVAGWLLYLPHERVPCLIINKILGTPPWCLLSAAITAACLVIVSLLVDRGPSPAWARLPELAGKNALLAYILAPIVYALFGGFAELTGTDNLLPVLATPFALGLARSIAMALLVTGVAAWLARRRITLKI
jgi:heparan-alpha-glucosaminide N-acetyltransferase